MNATLSFPVLPLDEHNKELLSKVIHPYPTQAEAITRVADAYSRTRLTPLVKRLFAHWMAWQRR